MKINQPGGRNSKKVAESKLLNTKNQSIKELYTLKASGEWSSGLHTLKARENGSVELGVTSGIGRIPVQISLGAWPDFGTRPCCTRLPVIFKSNKNDK